MQITSRFAIAVHMLICIHNYSSQQKVTSEFIAGSTNVNSVIIRRILIQLQAAGLIIVARGPGGSKVAKNINHITLLDIYEAVESVDGDLFHFHNTPNPQCPVGRNIHNLLDEHLNNAQKAMEASLRKVTLADLIDNFSVLEKIAPIIHS